MIDLKLKAKIRLHYESNFDNAKEVSRAFEINYRTLMKWIEKEKWQKGVLVGGRVKRKHEKRAFKKGIWHKA